MAKVSWRESLKGASIRSSRSASSSPAPPRNRTTVSGPQSSQNSPQSSSTSQSSVAASSSPSVSSAHGPARPSSSSVSTNHQSPPSPSLGPSSISSSVVDPKPLLSTPSTSYRNMSIRASVIPGLPRDVSLADGAEEEEESSVPSGAVARLVRFYRSRQDSTVVPSSPRGEPKSAEHRLSNPSSRALGINNGAGSPRSSTSRSLLHSQSAHSVYGASPRSSPRNSGVVIHNRGGIGHGHPAHSDRGGIANNNDFGAPVNKPRSHTTLASSHAQVTTANNHLHPYQAEARSRGLTTYQDREDSQFGLALDADLVRQDSEEAEGEGEELHALQIHHLLLSSADVEELMEELVWAGPGVGKGAVGSVGSSNKVNNWWHSLEFSGCQLDTQAVQVIVKTVKHCVKMRKLVIEANPRLGDHEAGLVAGVVAENAHITSLALWKNNIHSGGADSLARLLAGSTLTHLDLSLNTIESAGGEALAKELGNSTNLRSLNLASCSLGSAGGAAFGPALASNSGLTWLNLSCNGIGDQGAIALGNGLRVNKALRTLLLQWNNIQEKGSYALLEALETNTFLQVLQFGGFGDFKSSNIQYALKAALQRNTNRRDSLDNSALDPNVLRKWVDLPTDGDALEQNGNDDEDRQPNMLKHSGSLHDVLNGAIGREKSKTSLENAMEKGGHGTGQGQGQGDRTSFESGNGDDSGERSRSSTHNPLEREFGEREQKEKLGTQKRIDANPTAAISIFSVLANATNIPGSLPGSKRSSLTPLIPSSPSSSPPASSSVSLSSPMNAAATITTTTINTSLVLDSSPSSTSAPQSSFSSSSSSSSTSTSSSSSSIDPPLATIPRKPALVIDSGDSHGNGKRRVKAVHKRSLSENMNFANGPVGGLAGAPGFGPTSSKRNTHDRDKEKDEDKEKNGKESEEHKPSSSSSHQRTNSKQIFNSAPNPNPTSTSDSTKQHQHQHRSQTSRALDTLDEDNNANGSSNAAPSGPMSPSSAGLLPFGRRHVTQSSESAKFASMFAEYENRAEEYRQMLRKMETDLASSHDKLRAKEAELMDSSTLVNALSSKLSNAESVLVEMVKETEAQKKQEKEDKARESNLRAKQVNEVQLLIDRLKTVQAELSELKEQREAELMLSSKPPENPVPSSAGSDGQGARKESEDDLNSMREQLESAYNKLAASEEVVSAQKKDLASLNQQLTQMTTLNENLNDELSTLESRLSAMSHSHSHSHNSSHSSHGGSSSSSASAQVAGASATNASISIVTTTVASNTSSTGSPQAITRKLADRLDRLGSGQRYTAPPTPPPLFAADSNENFVNPNRLPDDSAIGPGELSRRTSVLISGGGGDGDDGDHHRRISFSVSEVPSAGAHMGTGGMAKVMLTRSGSIHSQSSSHDEYRRSSFGVNPPTGSPGHPTNNRSRHSGILTHAYSLSGDGVEAVRRRSNNNNVINLPGIVQQTQPPAAGGGGGGGLQPGGGAGGVGGGSSSALRRPSPAPPTHKPPSRLAANANVNTTTSAAAQAASATNLPTSISSLSSSPSSVSSPRKLPPSSSPPQQNSSFTFPPPSSRSQPPSSRPPSRPTQMDERPSHLAQPQTYPHYRERSESISELEAQAEDQGGIIRKRREMFESSGNGEPTVRSSSKSMSNSGVRVQTRSVPLPSHPPPASPSNGKALPVPTHPPSRLPSLSIGSAPPSSSPSSTVPTNTNTVTATASARPTGGNPAPSFTPLAPPQQSTRKRS